MVDLATMLAGLADAFSLATIIFVMLGVVVGQFVGAMPGIGPVITMAVVIPFTFVMDPLPAIGLLVGIMKGGSIGGAIPAILINVPGTPDAAATSLDGYPMAKAGKPEKALKIALYSSVTGDTFSDIVLISVSAPLAILALKMGPVEVFGLMVFSFAVISSLLGSSISKGLIALVLGLVLSMVGMDSEHSTPRLIFGQWAFFEGLPVAPVAIGSLAVAEIFRHISKINAASGPLVMKNGSNIREDRRISFREYWACKFVMLRGAIIGTGIGAVPGVGSTAAAFMSYAATKQADPKPESYGTGNVKGVAATESANSAVAGADMIPLLTLGIPGSASAAMLIGAFVIQGIQPGPLLFENQGRLIYGLFGAMLIANFSNLIFGIFGLRLWAKIISAPPPAILSSALVLCLVGAYLSSGGMLGIWVMLVFAALGYLMTSFGYPIVVFIIAFFLGPRFELSLIQTLIVTKGQVSNLTNYPVALAFFILT
ncbi:MAG: tripartite tricarboxylate transporter permease, partial [Pseudomonadota bacterium]